MKISLVPAHEIVKVWPEIEEILNKAIELSGGRFTPASILHECLSGSLSLWVVINDDKKIMSAFTVRIVKYAQRKSLYLEVLAGEKFKDWMDQLFHTMIDWGRVHGCTHIETGGRIGWKRLGEKHGFEVAYTVLERKI